MNLLQMDEDSANQIFSRYTSNYEPPGSIVFFKAEIDFAHKTVKMIKSME